MKNAFLNSTLYVSDRFDSFSLSPNFLLFSELAETSLIRRIIPDFLFCRLGQSLRRGQ